jgi:16S rRNA (uracil1498-N3)-methyltransferase
MEISNSRQFHVHPSIIGDECICIPMGSLYRQMVTVLRLGKGDAVRFFDGIGNVVEGTFAHANKDGIVITIKNRYLQTRANGINLAIGILKNDRMRWVLEKATELGVRSIIPMITERVIKRPATPPPRWKLIIKEAAEQSGHAWLPSLENIKTFRDVVALPHDKLMCAIGSTQPLARPSAGEHIIMVGPEGGFTPQELDFAESHGASLMHLGDKQLRADTAAVVAISRLS